MARVRSGAKTTFSWRPAALGTEFANESETEDAILYSVRPLKIGHYHRQGRAADGRVVALES